MPKDVEQVVFWVCAAWVLGWVLIPGLWVLAIRVDRWLLNRRARRFAAACARFRREP